MSARKSASPSIIGTSQQASLPDVICKTVPDKASAIGFPRDLNSARQPRVLLQRLSIRPFCNISGIIDCGPQRIQGGIQTNIMNLQCGPRGPDGPKEVQIPYMPHNLEFSGNGAYPFSHQRITLPAEFLVATGIRPRQST